MEQQDIKMQQYLLLAKNARGRALADLVSKATAEPGLFAYGELLDLPAVTEMASGDLQAHHTLLQLFAYGTYPEYKHHAATLPQLTDQHILKLKQLTVVSLANQHKVIPYAMLQQQLDIPNVRDLEDFIITHCFYTSILQGKLDQRQATLQIHSTIGRDVKPDQVGTLTEQLNNWIGTCEGLLRTIEVQVAHAAQAAEATAKHKEELDAKVDEVKKTIKNEEGGFRIGDAMMVDDGLLGDMMEEDLLDRFQARQEPRDRGDRVSGRQKSRRR